jgi:hypothetical protein
MIVGFNLFDVSTIYTTVITLFRWVAGALFTYSMKKMLISIINDLLD